MKITSQTLINNNFSLIENNFFNEKVFSKSFYIVYNDSVKVEFVCELSEDDILFINDNDDEECVCFVKKFVYDDFNDDMFVYEKIEDVLKVEVGGVLKVDNENICEYFIKRVLED